MTLTTQRQGVLPAGVSLWRFDIDRDPAEVARLAEVLSPAELRRARRFRFPRDRSRYVVGRGLLRQALGELTGRHPATLELRTGPFGKPELVGSGVSFNLSHAEGMAVMVATRAGPVGVDLERIRPVPDGELMATRFFSDHEVAALHRVPARARDEAFLRCWTRKEAYVKAVGGGLSMALRDFAVSVDAGDVPAIVWAVDPSAAHRWSVTDLSAYVPGHVAALVATGSLPEIHPAPRSGTEESP